MHQAGWIAPRLTPWENGYAITIVVPAGFGAYARVLHPAGTPGSGNRLLRWADVAAWSGMPLRKGRAVPSGRAAAGRTWPAARPAAPVRQPGPRRRAACGCRTPGSWPHRAGLDRHAAGLLVLRVGLLRLGRSPARPPSWPRRGSRARLSRGRGGTRCRAQCALGRGCTCRIGTTSCTRGLPSLSPRWPAWTLPGASARTCGGPATVPGA